MLHPQVVGEIFNSWQDKDAHCDHVVKKSLSLKRFLLISIFNYHRLHWISVNIFFCFFLLLLLQLLLFVRETVHCHSGYVKVKASSVESVLFFHLDIGSETQVARPRTFPSEPPWQFLTAFPFSSSLLFFSFLIWAFIFYAWNIYLWSRICILDQLLALKLPLSHTSSIGCPFVSTVFKNKTIAVVKPVSHQTTDVKWHSLGFMVCCQHPRDFSGLTSKQLLKLSEITTEFLFP